MAFEAGAVELEAGRAVFAAGEGDEVGTHPAEEGQVFLRVGPAHLSLGEEDELGGQCGGEGFGERTIVGGLGGLPAEFADDLQGFLPMGPLAEAALFPLGDVLIAQRVAFEFGGDEFLDLGKGVQPNDEFLRGFTVAEALVEFLADHEWEPRDFAVTGTSHGI